jgi:hypothetical protein
MIFPECNEINMLIKIKANKEKNETKIPRGVEARKGKSSPEIMTIIKEKTFKIKKNPKAIDKAPKARPTRYSNRLKGRDKN